MLRLLSTLILLVLLDSVSLVAHAQENGVEVESVASTNPVVINAEETGENSASDAQVEEPAPEVFKLPVEQHAWTRFQPGAWREIQITTETFDPEGQVINRSITTQKEILKSFDENSYTLEVQATVDLVGKRIVGEWKTRVLDLITDSTGEILETIQLENSSLSVDGISQECQVWQVRYAEDGKQMLEQIYYLPEKYPFILQRDSANFDAGEEGIEFEDSTKTIASKIPYVVDGSMIQSTSQQTLRKRQKGNSTRIVFISPEIPGGEAAAWTSDFDSQGKINRWSTLELIDYGLPTSTP